MPQVQVKSPLAADRFGRTILRLFRGRRPPREIEEAYEEAVQISEKKKVYDSARKAAAKMKLTRLREKNLAGGWAETVLKSAEPAAKTRPILSLPK